MSGVECNAFCNAPGIFSETNTNEAQRSKMGGDAMKRKRGGQPGNKNAVGNKGGHAPYGNTNAWKHGGYAVAQMQRGITRYTLNKMLDEMTPEQIRKLRDR